MEMERKGHAMCAVLNTCVVCPGTPLMGYNILWSVIFFGIVNRLLDESWSDTVIEDGHQFNLEISKRFDRVWKVAFGGSWKKEVFDTLISMPALRMSAYGFTDINSKSLFNIMVGTLLPFYIYTFRLNERQETLTNLDRQISTAIEIAFDNIGNEKNKKVLGFCSGSTNLMTLTRKMLSAEVETGSCCVVSAFGCCFLTLSNRSEDICSVQEVKDVLGKTVKAAQVLRKIHFANDLLTRARIGMERPPPTLKSYSKTRWNGVAALFDSVLRSKDLITSILTLQKITSNSERVLDLRTNSKASAVVVFALDS
eukprot:IDg1721t1